MTTMELNTPARQEAAAIEYCRALTQQRARNFYYGLRLSPEPARSALYTIYAWMRRADDLVDGDALAPPASADPDLHRKVQHFRQATDDALAGAPLDADPLWLALHCIARRHALPAHCFHAVLDGQLDDLAHRTYATFPDLRLYCTRVASAVGLLCIEVWGYSSDRALGLAENRGIAFQLTNILRDFRQDWHIGRVYLPAEDFARHNLSPEDLHLWRSPRACETFLREQIERAEAYYQSSRDLESLITPACVPTLRAMTAIYHGLLKKMRANPASLVDRRRIRLSTWQKAFIALRAKWSVANGT